MDDPRQIEAKDPAHRRKIGQIGHWVSIALTSTVMVAALDSSYPTVIKVMAALGISTGSFGLLVWMDLPAWQARPPRPDGSGLGPGRFGKWKPLSRLDVVVGAAS